MIRFGIFALGLLGAVALAHAAPDGVIRNSVAVCDPNSPKNCMAPDGTGAMPVTPATAAIFSTVPVGASFVNMTTATNTVIKSSPGVFVGVVVNTAGAGSTVTIYNNTVCAGDTIGTFSTVAQVSLAVNAIAPVGICATTTGGTPADITILYR